MINMLEIGIIELLLQYVPWALYTRKAAVGYSTSSLEMQMKLPGTRACSEGVGVQQFSQPPLVEICSRG